MYGHRDIWHPSWFCIWSSIWYKGAWRVLQQYWVINSCFRLNYLAMVAYSSSRKNSQSHFSHVRLDFCTVELVWQLSNLSILRNIPVPAFMGRSLWPNAKNRRRLASRTAFLRHKGPVCQQCLCQRWKYGQDYLVGIWLLNLIMPDPLT